MQGSVNLAESFGVFILKNYDQKLTKSHKIHPNSTVATTVQCNKMNNPQCDNKISKMGCDDNVKISFEKTNLISSHNLIFPIRKLNALA